MRVEISRRDIFVGFGAATALATAFAVSLPSYYPEQSPIKTIPPPNSIVEAATRSIVNHSSSLSSLHKNIEKLAELQHVLFEADTINTRFVGDALRACNTLHFEKDFGEMHPRLRQLEAGLVHLMRPEITEAQKTQLRQSLPKDIDNLVRQGRQVLAENVHQMIVSTIEVIGRVNKDNNGRPIEKEERREVQLLLVELFNNIHHSKGYCSCCDSLVDSFAQIGTGSRKNTSLGDDLMDAINNTDRSTFLRVALDVLRKINSVSAEAIKQNGGCNLDADMAKLSESLRQRQNLLPL